MAIPFYEPKTPTTAANTNNSSNTNNNNGFENNGQSVNQIHYDQVDGLLSSTQVLNSTSHQQATTMASPTILPTAIPNSLATMSSISMQAPTIATNSATGTTPLTTATASIEQQALAWKILALTLCKALKEYHLQTASSKDAFTNQTVQILPNGDIQPLWK